MTTHRILLNKLLLVSVLAATAIWTALQFLGWGAWGGTEFWGIGRVTGLIVALSAGYLLSNLRHLGRATYTATIVMAWVPWVLLGAAFAEGNGVAEWLSGEFFPVLLWPLTYLLFYTYAKQAGWTPLLERYFLCLSVGCVALFFAVFETVNADRTGNYQQVNAVYFPLLTLPWVAVARSRVWRLGGALVIVLAVSYSLKRTALVALALAAVVYVLAEAFARARSGRLRALASLLLLMAISGVAYLRVDEARGDAFSERILSSREDQGSSRLEIYQEVVSGIDEAPFAKLMFGHGYNATLEAFGLTAHNDFLEVAYDYGLIGLFLYLLLHASLVRTAFILLRQRSPYASAFAMSYALFFAISMASHLIVYPSYFAYLVAFWGAVEGLRRWRQAGSTVDGRGLDDGELFAEESAPEPCLEAESPAGTERR